jgi:multidrug efflux pump subunit AcrB
MAAIVRWCLKNKSVVLLAAVLLIASGAYATTRLNQELLPDISFPVIVVQTPVTGAGPDLVDKQVTQPVESAINSVDGINSVQSTSSQGFSVVVVEFDLDTDTDKAKTDLQNVLDGVALPQQAGRPEVTSQSASQFPIINLSLSAKDGDLAGLTKYAQDTVVPEIEDVDGVASADLVGGAEKRIEVKVDPGKLKEKDISTDAAVGAISGANVDAPVGSAPVDGLDTPVRAKNELANADALKKLPVGVSGASAASSGAPVAPAGVAPGAAASGEVPAGEAVPSGAPAGTAGAVSGASGASGGETPKPVLLGDVAEVRTAPSDLSGISRTNGKPSLGLNIVKEKDANTVEVAAAVDKKLGDVRDKLGDGQVVVVNNAATSVKESVNGLVEEALVGAVLAILVIFAFLRSLRATLVTAVSLPTSVLAALLFSWGDNLTLNIITLAGLTIAVGRVVDDAIVVLENSYRYVQQGLDSEEAALRGTTDVASAITSSTLTTTAVFAPLAIVGGIVSKFFVPLSLTVALALLASLIVAVTVIPVLVSIFLKRRVEQDRVSASEEEATSEGRRMGGVARFVIGVVVFLVVSAVALAVASKAGVLNGLPGFPQSFTDAVDGIVSGFGLSWPVFLAVAATIVVLLLVGTVLLARRRPPSERPAGRAEDGLLVGIYTPMLRWSLRHRLIVPLLALLAFAAGLATIPFLPVSFFPPSEEHLLIADAELPTGTGLQQTSDKLRSFEDFLAQDEGIKSYQVSIGGENTFNPDTPVRPSNQAEAYINVKSGSNVNGALKRVDKEGNRLYGSKFKVQIVSNGPPQGGLEAVLTGGSDKQLAEASKLVSKEFQKLDNVNNVQSDLSSGNREVSVNADPAKAAKAGLSPGSVSTSLGALLGNSTVTSIGDVPVYLGVPKDSADSIEKLKALPVSPGTTAGDVAEIKKVDAPVAISRSDGDRAVTVTGNITSKDTQSVSTEAKAAVDKLDLPGGVKANVGGESDDINDSFRNLFLSIIVALVLVYLILVVFFGSILIPLVILLAVPLTTVGAFGALYLTDTAISLPSLLGILLLIGIVVSNAILLVDFAIKARDDYETSDEALIAAGQARLRPILMTALATIFALAPLGLGLAGGGSSLISSSLAITVIGGLTTSTFLTLLVVPVGYSLLKGDRRRKKKG